MVANVGGVGGVSGGSGASAQEQQIVVNMVEEQFMMIFNQAMQQTGQIQDAMQDDPDYQNNDD